MGLFGAYRLRLARKRKLLRSWLKSRELRPVADRTEAIRADDILLFTVLRNERDRLDHFLAYYRGMGIGHFLVVDNGSDDGSGGFLAGEPDVSVWSTTASYKRARYGMDWLNHLLGRHGAGHWTLTVDVDEFLVYAHADTRPLRALTDWLDASALKAFPAMLVDLYADRPVEETQCPRGGDPVAAAPFFDAGNYTIRRNARFGNLWIQGGPRQRAFFADRPEEAPALNKIPLVRWKRGYVYTSSTHSLLPRGLNLVYDEWGGEKPAGALLHAKFLASLGAKAEEELRRRQHYAGSREYRAYRRRIGQGLTLWTPQSSRYEGWRQLEEAGLLSAGGWL